LKEKERKEMDQRFEAGLIASFRAFLYTTLRAFFELSP